MLSLRARKGRIAGFVATLATVSATAAVVAPLAGAAPPAPPPGCSVVVNTPASVTGAPQGQANKAATFDRLCLP
jgi:hypothetical protein